MDDRLLTAEELRAIEERVAQATPGPWRWVDMPLATVEGEPVHRCAVAGGGGVIFQAPLFGPMARPSAGNDADFVANSRSDVPRLLADLRRYRGWCQRLVACADAIREDESVDGTLSLAGEVRATLEGK